MEYQIALLPGDGIGPEIVREAKKVLEKIGNVYGHAFSFREALVGGAAIDATGAPLPQETLRIVRESNAVLMGSVGGDAKNPATARWYQVDPKLRPEAGLLGLRKGLGLFANLRPAYLYPQLADACPLKKETVPGGFDMVIVRELTGGLYFGERGTQTVDGVRRAFDTCVYDEKEIRRVAVKAFDIAMKRGRKLLSVDKHNVLDTSRLWRQVVEEVGADYPQVALSHMYVDNCAMQLVHDPGAFDVVVTDNMFGDILSDEASMITGSIGMLPSASLNETKFGVYEPSHGSAPDIAGKGIANPIATILSAALLLRYSLDLEEEAKAVEAAVEKALEAGYRTADIAGVGTVAGQAAADGGGISTGQMGDVIAGCIG
ncbi:MAG: 3-isopropylmalate dehydrogenase [Lachnospiraceae bacterium]|nr:3-isopropylmalate dehydrogenase [Lachnospiraceae bacterium]